MGWKFFLMVMLLVCCFFIGFSIFTIKDESFTFKNQPTILCEGGYQAIITTGKSKMMYHLTDKHDKKIPCER